MEVSIAIILVVIMVSVLLHHYNIKKQKQLQHRGLTNITHIKALISALQTHRGVSSAWLNGDQSKQPILVKIERQVDELIQFLMTQHSVINNGRWASFIDHWGRLNQVGHNSDAQHNFNQHTTMIASLLYLLEDEAEQHALNAITLRQFSHIGFVWRELVVTTEIIGQSRAIGTGVATRKVCSSVDNIRLSFLLQDMQQTISETLPKLSSLASEREKHNLLLDLAKSEIKLLTTSIEQDLIAESQVSINQDKYFALASNSIKALDNIFAHQVEQLNRVI